MYWSQVQVDDEYNTPKELWENLKEFLPKKDVIVLGSLLWKRSLWNCIE
jgi:hypothetical protein